MIQIPYEELIAKIMEKSGLSEDQINIKINQKLEQLSGLISKDGAAHIVANELGVKVMESDGGKVDIKNIFPGMRNVEAVGKVSNVFPIREFNTNGRKGKVCSFVIHDKTGSIRAVAWNSQADKAASLNVNDIVRIKSGYVRQNNDNKELHLNDRSVLSINPSDHNLEMPDFDQPGVKSSSAEPTRKDIKDLCANDNNIEILGTIVQVFEPRFYEVCRECGKRVRLQDESFVCPTHGNIDPDYAYFVSLTIDDGTENIRSVAFRNEAESLLGINKESMIAMKDNPGDFESKKTALLGSIVKLSGRVTENSYFNRKEFIVQSVDMNPDPEKEIEILNKEMQEIK